MRYLIIVSLAIIFTSCSKNLQPFSSDLIVENEFSDNDVRNIQFYLSEDIVLHRQLGRTETSIEDGEIKIIEGKRIEEVVIEKGTPGVYGGKTEKGKFKIFFDIGDQDFLAFGPNPKRQGNFVLLAEEWNNKRGIVHYGGKKYKTKTSSSYSKLMVDLKKIRKQEKNSRKAKGVLIN